MPMSALLLLALPTAAHARSARVAAAEALVAQADAMDEVPAEIRADDDAFVEEAIARKDTLAALDAEAEALAPRRGGVSKRSALGVARATARLDFADLLVEIPVPDEIAADPDLSRMYAEEIGKLTAPLERQAFNELVAVVELGARKRRWTAWQTLAVETLAARAPDHHVRWTELQRDPAAFARGCRQGVAAACALSGR